MTDINELVEKAAEPKTFNVLDVAQGRGYPEDSITIYTDVASAYALRTIKAQHSNETDEDTVNQLDVQIDELTQKIKDSARTFYLRGFPNGVTRNILTEAKSRFDTDDVLQGDAADWCNLKYVAESIVKVENAQGEVDGRHWSVDEVEQLRALLPQPEFDRLSEAVYALSFASAYFDGLVDADF